MNNTTKILIGVGLVALFAFKNPKKKKYKTYTLKWQAGSPAGSKQVFSKVGTIVYDKNFNKIYHHDIIGVGMTVIGETIDKYEIVLGISFSNGIPGWVYKNSVFL